MSSDTDSGSDIAIIGMAGRFPGARDVDEFWANLCAGTESIRAFSPAELADLGIDPERYLRPEFVPAGAPIADADRFDHRFFGYSPREAALMDPQQRLFLETSWAALEHAGRSALDETDLVGVYAGTGLSTYLLFNLAGNPAVTEADELLAMLGNDKDFLSTRVAYHLNLRGPSMTVQTGCSTSLVAAHLAVDGLLSYQCDTALVGGVSLVLPQRTGYLHHPGSTASSDGHCRAFDARGDGTVFGSGVGAIVLKRLPDALADGSVIYAVIKGSACNNDGAQRAGFTAPSVEGQAEVIVRAHQVAGVSAADISYVEAHGTATRYGDPVEVTALTKAFRHSTDATGYCALGSVKTNVGHLDAAAGVTSLIKTALSLHHRQLPPSLNFQTPNPQIDFAASPFYVNTSLCPWEAGAGPRRAGVSAFGFGGTNAHLILEEAPARSAPAPTRRPQLITLSARTDTALAEMAAQVAGQLRADGVLELADVAHTLRRGRVRFEHRRAFVARDRDDAAELLANPPSGRVRQRQDAKSDRGVVFMFSGLGDQYPGMGVGLYEQEPVFRQTIDKCCELLRPLLGHDLRDVLYPAAASSEAPSGTLDLRAMLAGASSDSTFQRTSIAHPALFVTEYAMARLWESWGVRPEALIGHSLGEYIAATFAGVFALPDALAFVARRAQLIAGLPAGVMLAVPVPAGELADLAPPGTHVALVNGPRFTVAAGSHDAIAVLEQALAGRRITSRRLNAEHAFHTPMLEPVIDPLRELAATMELAPPRMPFISNVSGDWITEAQATDPRYWSDHSTRPVQFTAGLSALRAGRDDVLLELGPGHSLCSLALEHAADQGDPPAVASSLRAGYDSRVDDLSYLLEAAAELYVAGATRAQITEPGREPRRVALPSYPFERERAWIGPAAHSAQAGPAQGRRSSPDSWFWTPGWRTIAPPGPASRPGGEHWLVLTGPDDRCAGLLRAAAAAGRRLTELSARDPAECEALLDTLAARGDLPAVVLDLRHRPGPADVGGGTVAADAAAGPDPASGLLSLTALLRALARRKADCDIEVWLLTQGLAQVESSDVLDPQAALLLGPAMCGPQEYDGISIRCLDLPAASAAWPAPERLLAVIGSSPAERLLAPRGDRLWVRQFDQLAARKPVFALPAGGVHLITGGLGTIGLDLAEHLAERLGGHFILTGRTPFPEPGQWDYWLARHPGDDATSMRIRRLRQITSLGCTVLVRAADVADAARMREIAEEARDRFGRIDGIIHAAGITGQRTFQMLDEATASSVGPVLRAKVAGTQVIGDLASRHQPGYVLLLSSNVSILGGIGACAYSAANHFLNAYAQQRHQATGTRWLSVSIEEWLADDAALPVLSFTQYGLRPDEGVSALFRSVECAPAGWTAVVTGDLEQRVDQWIRHPEAARRPRSGDDARRQPRPTLAVRYAEPTDETEQAVAEFWQDILGVEPVGRDDNFYLLGGHSLLATQIVTRVRARFGVEMSLLMLLNRPTVAGFAEHVRELLASGVGPAGPAIEPARRGPAMPLSYAQRRFWFFDQLVPGNPMYNIPDVVGISGPLSLTALKASINQIIARHESLRTSFAAVNGQPVQRIAAQVRLSLPVIDLSGLPEPERTAAWEREALAEADRPFDLSAAPLLRATVLKLAEANHILLLTSHHSVSDAWSSGIFIRELAACYAASQGGGSAVLPDLAIQYPDFALWQQRYLSSQTLERLLSYWRAELAGAPPLTGFPADRERPPAQTFAGATHPVELSAALVDRLVRIGGGQGCTLFMTLLAAFNCLLYRYTGEQDLVVGSPIAGRVRAELEDLIGVFVNMIPLRTVISPGEPFTGLLGRVRQSTLQAYAHQDLPFELAVEALSPLHSLSHHQIFQHVLVLQNAPLPPLELSGLTLRQIPRPASTAKFDFMLMLRQTDSGAVGGIEYATDLFSPATIEQIGRHFIALLEAICAEPACPVADLAIEPAAQRGGPPPARTAGPATPLPADSGTAASVPALFTAHASIRPDAVAVRMAGTDDGVLTFGELAALSDRVARVLLARGIGAGCRVGVSLDRSPATAAVLLGIMKTRAAYVPLDPGYPRPRLEFMARDAGLDLLITSQDQDAGAVTLEPALVLPAGELLAACELVPVGPLDVLVRPDDPAYVLYTSGSTGQPKGAVGLHGGMVNRFEWMWREYPFGPGEMLCQKTSLNFLDSFWEMFGGLCHGVPVTIIPQWLLLEPDELVRTLASERVTRIVLVPSLLRLLLDTVPNLAGRLPGLALWTVSGEALTGELAARFLAELPGRALLNLYGSSEVSADVTCHQVTAADTARRLVPIGRPIDGTWLHILDERMRPVPASVPGDIYVGGVSLGQGYLGRPGLTAERFVPDPHAAEPGALLFRTGDRGRFRHDGVIEYLGRRDHQVKVRGFRIELAEVESALASHPMIAQAAAAVHADALVGYYAPMPGTAPEPGQILAFLRDRLPGHQVPSAIVACEALPLTQSGKLDRSALPAPARLVGADETPPRDPLEEALAIVWLESLDQDGPAGVFTNFFAAGGHSLSATRFVMRVREDLDVALPLRAFLADPTIASLAAVLREHAASASELMTRSQLLIEIAAMSADQVDELLSQTARPGEDA